MKKIFKPLVLLSAVLLIFSCSDFEEINVDPLAANIDQVEVEFLINNSIGGAQMNPHISERVYYLYWLDASKMNRIGVLSEGSHSDGWTTDYFKDYISKWLTDINSAISVAEHRIATDNAKEYTGNLMQIARIWRTYIMSELTDGFGPIPIAGFKAVNPEYNSVQDVYYFMLEELTDAVSKIDESIDIPDRSKDLDPAYNYDYTKWKKYANSLRMRLAMRLSEVDPAKAQQEFEAAVGTGLYIDAAADNFSVLQGGGWDNYTNVMSRQWNSYRISPTYKNLVTGLGSVTSASQLPLDQHATIKAADYMGLKFDDHFTSLTNDPTAGFWLDGLPNTIDPRAYKTFPIPGDIDNPDMNNYPTWSSDYSTTERDLIIGEVDNSDENTETDDITIDAAFTYNAFPVGDLGIPGSLNKLIFNGALPRLAHHFRDGSDASDNRVFFASWESYFLIAEAAARGWSAPMSGQVAYEAGIGESFTFFGVSGHLATYLASQDYNNNGTSVSWGHTTEPPATVSKNYVDGYTGVAGTVNFTYPENTIYQGGSVKNDLLNKIITQKYLAQTPWLPLEAWSDHRRLGLPFFENPAVENPLPDLPALNPGNVMTNQVGFFGQRLKYPSYLENNVPVGFGQAVDLLGGPNEVHTPLWWAQQN